ncbi:MAG: hypothetical protein M1820_006596 [Bogoriella megaspora]|nr:MAG: hypothetical protein M1820_006596 [Bogoriella megaspora]
MASHKSSGTIPSRAEASRMGTLRPPQSRLPTKHATSALPSGNTTPHYLSQTTNTSRSDSGRVSSKTDGRLQQNNTMAGRPDVKRQFSGNTSKLSRGDFSSKKSQVKTQSSSFRTPPLDSTMGSQTPSLTSGSSVSTTDSARSRTLRRKPSTIDRYATNAQKEHTAPGTLSIVDDSSGSGKGKWQGSILGISIPSESPTSIYPEDNDMVALDDSRIEASAAVEEFSQPKSFEIAAPPRTPGIPLSETPSTRCSESPGVFSYASTPTSMSSYSPGNLSSKFAPRARTISPAQQVHAPVVHQKTTPDGALSLTGEQDLSTLSEKSTSSSSAATERPSGQTQQSTKQVQESAPRKIQTPPELAHLLTDPPSLRVPSRQGRPIRPTRDGTPTLDSREPSPVVQSNLPYFYNSYHKRQGSGSLNTASANGSTDSIPSINSDTMRARLYTSTTFASRGPSPSVDTLSKPGTPLGTTLGGISHQAMSKANGRGNVSTTPISESPSKSSRFGFFSKRTKQNETSAPVERPKREARKGPMAGTGHEGYGRKPLRSRRLSASSNDSVGSTSARGRRLSSHGSGAASPMDDFLAERLSPVVLRGEARSPNKDRSSWDIVSNVSNQSTPQLSDGESKRSSQESATAVPGNKSRPFRSPSPLKARLLGQQLPESERTARLTKPNTTNAAKPEQVKSAQKSSKRWNFFQRAQQPSKMPSNSSVTKPMSRQAMDHSTPHYALVNSEERMDLDDLDKMMQETEAMRDGYSSMDESDHLLPHHIPTMDSWAKPPEHVENQVTATVQTPAVPDKRDSRQAQSILLPSPPVLSRPFAHRASPSHTDAEYSALRPTILPAINQEEKAHSITSSSVPDASVPSTSPSESMQLANVSTGSNSPNRRSRLVQVGRIPQVVSKRDRERKLPTKSFSRPFANSQSRPNVAAPPKTPVGRPSSPVKDQKSAIDEKHLGATDEVRHDEDAERPLATITASNLHATDITNPPEFFAFPQRHNSELSYTSSSGNASFPGNALALTIPNTTEAHEEVWNEYDDLIDDVLSPSEEPASAKSALGAPFQYQPSSPVKSQSSAPETSSCVEDLKPKTNDAFADPIRRASTAPLTTPLLRQQRSSFLSALHSDGTRGSEISELIKGYAERNPSTGDLKKPNLSLPPSTRPSSAGTNFSMSPTAQSPASSNHSRSATATEMSVPPPMSVKPAKRESEDMISMANLRFGALMTSKWLSFGRVLFSPAHLEVKDGKDHRVLIVDGLGKDWSYYCALTYPNATVYNLGPNPSSTQSTANSAWQSLPNHRHIHHASISSPFPFPRGFFSAAVFRFPIATSEGAYREALSECKRVLRPGGHLELSILEIDMVNMGNRARKAVRQMKMKMQRAQGDVCLKSKTDSMIKLLGMRGFDNLHRCGVGIPAAGQLQRSPMSSPTTSENADKGHLKSTKPDIKLTPIDENSQDKKDATSDLSFGDILKSDTSGKHGGDAIAKMIARVGRWWWSSCYETPILSDDEASIWDDAALLKECETQGTSFKLLICYAQKPDISVRRTVSV